jgi:hypothetical protein
MDGSPTHERLVCPLSIVSNVTQKTCENNQINDQWDAAAVPRLAWPAEPSIAAVARKIGRMFNEP